MKKLFTQQPQNKRRIIKYFETNETHELNLTVTCYLHKFNYMQKAKHNFIETFECSKFSFQRNNSVNNFPRCDASVSR